MIEIENVSKRFLLKKALKNCSLTLNHGKIIGIIGENGSGKTTLLKLLSGVLKPSSGRVLIERDIVTRAISRKVAYLSDIDNFFTYFTVHELIQFYASQFNDFDRAAALKIARFMNLPLDVKIKQLSKGNRGRVKITVTFARRAHMLF